MNTCDTCKHWNRDYGYKGFKVCDVFDRLRFSEENDTITFAGSLDEDRNALNTHPKFGCIRWEKKP